ncbi:MAG: cytochrome b [Alphaproteobacteria bacterium]|nr:cytochrome b [Alphaproteobacteria bacterium]
MMKALDSPVRYGAVAMTLHWLIASTIIVNLYIGIEMADMARGDPDHITYLFYHKSIGLTVLVLSGLRLIWRWMNPVPPPPHGLNRLIRVSAKFMHYLFYVLIILIPLAGWLMVSVGAQGHATPVFGLFNWPAFPGLSGMTRSQGHPYHEAFETIHTWLAWSMVGLIPLHIGAALYHHYVRGDNVLVRMLPGTRLRRSV